MTLFLVRVTLSVLFSVACAIAMLVYVVRQKRRGQPESLLVLVVLAVLCIGGGYLLSP